MTTTVRLSGKTYLYRDTIKALGGKYDARSKTWTVMVSAVDRKKLTELPGVVVSDTPLTPNQQRFQKMKGFKPNGS